MKLKEISADTLRGELGVMVILAEPLTSRFTVAGADRDTLPSHVMTVQSVMTKTERKLLSAIFRARALLN